MVACEVCSIPLPSTWESYSGVTLHPEGTPTCVGGNTVAILGRHTWHVGSAPTHKTCVLHSSNTFMAACISAVSATCDCEYNC